MSEKGRREFISGLVERRPRFRLDDLPCVFCTGEARLTVVGSRLPALLSILEVSRFTRGGVALRVDRACHEEQELVGTGHDVVSVFPARFPPAGMVRLQDVIPHSRTTETKIPIHQSQACINRVGRVHQLIQYRNVRIVALPETLNPQRGQMRPASLQMGVWAFAHSNTKMPRSRHTENVWGLVERDRVIEDLQCPKTCRCTFTQSQGHASVRQSETISGVPPAIEKEQGENPETKTDSDGLVDEQHMAPPGLTSNPLPPAEAHPVDGIVAERCPMPQVSIVVPCKNSERYLARCLSSIRNQTYSNTETIVVDNFSTDRTRDIAANLGARVLICGPERSAQVNAGVGAAKGEYVFRVDSDFDLDPNAVRECVGLCQQGFDAVVVHNPPDRSGSWLSQVRRFEVDMYKFDLTYSAARFFRRTVFLSIGGYNPAITAGEDYDLQNRLNERGYRTGFANCEAVHLGEPPNLIYALEKYFRYGQDLVNFAGANRGRAAVQLSVVRVPYIHHWRRFIRNPAMGMSFLAYHFLKFAAGGLGFLYGSVGRGTERGHVHSG